MTRHTYMVTYRVGDRYDLMRLRCRARHAGTVASNARSRLQRAGEVDAVIVGIVDITTTEKENTVKRCPYPDCPFTGTDDEVDEHRIDNHRDEAQAGSNLNGPAGE